MILADKDIHDDQKAIRLYDSSCCVSAVYKQIGTGHVRARIGKEEDGRAYKGPINQ